MWAQIRQSDTSLSSHWRDDTPQEICALQQNSLFDAQSTRLIFCHFFKGPTYSFEGPFRGPCFDLEDAFIFFPLSTCRRKINVLSSRECNQCPYYTSLAPSILQRLMLLSALYPILFFFFGILHKRFRCRSFKGKVLLHSLYVLVVHQHSP